jgi:hypothetical protein
MAISTYAELKTAIASWLHRSDLTTVIPDFIALAESNIRRDVRCAAMEQQATGTLAADTLTVPTRFLEARNVAIDGWPQSYITPQEFTRQNDYTGNNFTIVGDEFRFQKSSGDYEIDYVQGFAPFSADGDTNWLLQNAPEIYLQAALMEAQQFIMGDPVVPATRYKRAIRDLQTSEQRYRYAGPLSVRPYARVV